MRKSKGVITLEAALVIPLVAMTIYVLMSLMSLVWVYDSVQTSLNNTAKTISSNCYVISQSGIPSITKLEGSGSEEDKAIGATILELINTILTDGIEAVDYKKLAVDVGAIDKIQETLDGLRGNEGSYGKNFAINIGNIFIGLMFKGELNETNLNGLVGDTTGLISKECLINDVGGGYVNKAQIDKRMKDIGIVDGINGVKVKAEFKLGDKTSTLEIVADYKMDIGNPLFETKPFEITQRVFVKPWIGKAS